ncbi:hypothetical protein LSTR_LSTR004238 [Laodelphax striatellus]|uniref:Endonuclease/exonuclease/phosphatase domain-containing protein n=1 Tax=Laodelphax striatellus TaxID=195883 RepID=A0A482XCM7_LAOST|nr:hypothetical protein LSTR_LSTR004238 [Laodelphax striatellus]
MDSLERLLGLHPKTAAAIALPTAALTRKGRHLTGTFCLSGDTMEGIIQCLVFLKAFSELKMKIVEFKGISERIAMLKLKSQGKLLHIYQVYAPTSMAEEAEHESFIYNSLTAALSRERNNWKNITLIIGDFNSQVGKQEEGERLTVGKYGYGQGTKLDKDWWISVKSKD